MRPAMAMKLGDFSCLCACVPGPGVDHKGDQLIFADEKGKIRVKPGLLGIDGSLSSVDGSLSSGQLSPPASRVAAGSSQQQGQQEEQQAETRSCGTAGKAGLGSSGSSNTGSPLGGAAATVLAVGAQQQQQQQLLQLQQQPQEMSSLSGCSLGSNGGPALREGTRSRCLADASECSAAGRGLPLLLVSLDDGTLLSPAVGTASVVLRARPFAAAFLARMQSEFKLSVAAFGCATTAGCLAARAEVLEAQAPGFRFDFLIHEGTASAWRQDNVEGKQRPTLVLSSCSTESCCVVACSGSASVEVREQDVAVEVAPYVPATAVENTNVDGVQNHCGGEGADQQSGDTVFRGFDTKSQPFRHWLLAQAAENPVVSAAQVAAAGEPDNAARTAPTLCELSHQLPEDWADY